MNNVRDDEDIEIVMALMPKGAIQKSLCSAKIARDDPSCTLPGRPAIGRLLLRVLHLPPPAGYQQDFDKQLKQIAKLPSFNVKVVSGHEEIKNFIHHLNDRKKCAKLKAESFPSGIYAFLPPQPVSSEAGGELVIKLHQNTPAAAPAPSPAGGKRRGDNGTSQQGEEGEGEEARRKKPRLKEEGAATAFTPHSPGGLPGATSLPPPPPPSSSFLAPSLLSASSLPQQAQLYPLSEGTESSRPSSPPGLPPLRPPSPPGFPPGHSGVAISTPPPPPSQHHPAAVAPSSSSSSLDAAQTGSVFAPSSPEGPVPPPRPVLSFSSSSSSFAASTSPASPGYPPPGWYDEDEDEEEEGGEQQSSGMGDDVQAATETGEEWGSDQVASADAYSSLVRTRDSMRNSYMYHLRRLNNAIKSSLISSAVSFGVEHEWSLVATKRQQQQQQQSASSCAGGLRVLDLACGKAGDIGKWRKIANQLLPLRKQVPGGLRRYVGVDIAKGSLFDAKARIQEMLPPSASPASPAAAAGAYATFPSVRLALMNLGECAMEDANSALCWESSDVTAEAAASAAAESDMAADAAAGGGTAGEEASAAARAARDREERGEDGFLKGAAPLVRKRTSSGSGLAGDGGDLPFHIVSMQFALHYMFQSLTRARTFFRDLSSWLVEGGKFVATTVDANVVVELLMSRKAVKETQVEQQQEQGGEGNACTSSSQWVIRIEDPVQLPQQVGSDLADGEAAAGSSSSRFWTRGEGTGAAAGLAELGGASRLDEFKRVERQREQRQRQRQQRSGRVHGGAGDVGDCDDGDDGDDGVNGSSSLPRQAPAICTITFEDEVYKRIMTNSGPSSAPSAKGGSTDAHLESMLGLRYFFNLKDDEDAAAVNAPEWLLPRPLLEALAKEAGLHLDFAQNFHEYLKEGRSWDARSKSWVAPAVPLHTLHGLKALNHQGTISQPEWEISRLYQVLQFTKRTTSSSAAATGSGGGSGSGTGGAAKGGGVSTKLRMAAMKAVKAEVGDAVFKQKSGKKRKELVEVKIAQLQTEGMQ